MRSLLLAMLLVGCAGDPELQPEGPHYQYVMSELRVPRNNNEARADGLDLNGDKSLDNQLGMVFGTLESLGFGVAGTAREALLRGGLIMLADVQTLDFTDSEASGVTTYLGNDPMPAPCLDPARLETCGQHVLGNGQFSIEPGSASDLGVAPFDDGVLSAAMGQLPVEIALDVNAPLRLDLRAARIRFTSISEDGFTGVIGGVITKADVDRVVVPQAAIELNRIVHTECGQPGETRECGCANRGAVLQDYFDTNHDCDLTLDEVARNSLVESLLSPDMEIKGQEGLSFGVGVEFRSATFE